MSPHSAVVPQAALDELADEQVKLPELLQLSGCF